MLVLRSKRGGLLELPELLVCRILLLMWSVGALLATLGSLLGQARCQVLLLRRSSCSKILEWPAVALKEISLESQTSALVPVCLRTLRSPYKMPHVRSLHGVV